MWYLDTRASGHMTREKNLIFDHSESHKGIVRFGDGSRISIEGYGKILLNSKDYTYIILKIVLYTPTLKANKLSLVELRVVHRSLTNLLFVI